jgi:hypothetical protein
MSLENTLSMETQAMEERLRDQITTLLEEAQDQAFSNYRATPYHLQYAASSLSMPQRSADMASDQSTGNTQPWSEPAILNQASYWEAVKYFQNMICLTKSRIIFIHLHLTQTKGREAWFTTDRRNLLTLLTTRYQTQHGVAASVKQIPQPPAFLRPKRLHDMS